MGLEGLDGLDGTRGAGAMNRDGVDETKLRKELWLK